MVPRMGQLRDLTIRMSDNPVIRDELASALTFQHHGSHIADSGEPDHRVIFIDNCHAERRTSGWLGSPVCCFNNSMGRVVVRSAPSR